MLLGQASRQEILAEQSADVRVQELQGTMIRARSRHRRNAEQSRRLVVPEHQVEILHRLTRRALAQVVDRREHNQRLRASLEYKPQLAKIGGAHVPQFGQLARL